MVNDFKDKIIFVSGGSGAIGAELVEALLSYEPKQVRVFSRDESKQYALVEKLGHPANLRLLIGDIRDKERLEFALHDVDIVFHAAALKHVPFCEYNPFETVKTNIIGSQNIIDAALKNNVEKVIGISTDKAANPNGVLGVSKLMMEKLFTNATYYKGNRRTIFSCVRFGNVAWARGSVLHLWKEQVKRDHVLKLTNGEMSRFIMSKKDAVDLIFEATKLAKGGEVFVFKMPSVKIADLATVFLKKYCSGESVGVHLVGSRAGEKLHEELLGIEAGSNRIIENDKLFVIIPKAHFFGLVEDDRGEYIGFTEVPAGVRYSSEDHIDIEKVSESI